MTIMHRLQHHYKMNNKYQKTIVQLAKKLNVFFKIKSD